MITSTRGYSNTITLPQLHHHCYISVTIGINRVLDVVLIYVYILLPRLIRKQLNLSDKYFGIFESTTESAKFGISTKKGFKFALCN